MDIEQRIDRNVHMVAEGRGLTIAGLVDGMGMSPQVFHKRLKGPERGGSKWKAAELELLASLLDITIETLVSEPSDLLSRMRGWVTADELVAA